MEGRYRSIGERGAYLFNDSFRAASPSRFSYFIREAPIISRIVLQTRATFSKFLLSRLG